MASGNETNNIEIEKFVDDETNEDLKRNFMGVYSEAGPLIPLGNHIIQSQYFQKYLSYEVRFRCLKEGSNFKVGSKNILKRKCPKNQQKAFEVIAINSQILF